ncbi:hypothetical protein C8Q80DRAFT_886334 [Daedaleopsis nitida]|nr:hypothetical protein C8Q80DRAFT_886334 [Daedaleopsis nitida]
MQLGDSNRDFSCCRSAGSIDVYAPSIRLKLMSSRVHDLRLKLPGVTDGDPDVRDAFPVLPITIARRRPLGSKLRCVNCERFNLKSMDTSSGPLGLPYVERNHPTCGRVQCAWPQAHACSPRRPGLGPRLSLVTLLVSSPGPLKERSCTYVTTSPMGPARVATFTIRILSPPSPKGERDRESVWLFLFPVASLESRDTPQEYNCPCLGSWGLSAEQRYPMATGTSAPCAPCARGLERVRCTVHAYIQRTATCQRQAQRAR